jgi:hypothetical protein
MAKRPALFVLPALWLAGGMLAGPASTGPAPDYAQIGELDPAAGRAVLAEVRQAGISGPYYLEFALRILPRRGDERVVPGRLWGDRTAEGPLLRISLDPGRPDERRWLIQGGAQPAAWRREAGGAPRPAGLLEPLWDGGQISPFDLQMPFLYWPDETVLSVNRIRGRPADAFLFRPPPDFVLRNPEVAAVRAYFDAEYHAPVQTELLGANGRPLKRWILADLKKVADTWIPKEFDVRNEATRDKTRIEVTGAALNAPLLPALFAPESLDEAVAPPAGVAHFAE